MKSDLYDLKDFYEGFVNALARVEKSIMAEIKQIAGDDESEIARIKKAYQGSWDDFDKSDRDELEIFLSFAFLSCRVSSSSLNEGNQGGEGIDNLSLAFETLIQACAYLGNAQGLDIATNKRRLLLQMAALRKNAQNIEDKNEAVEFYKAHRAEFKNKDEAAQVISDNLVPQTFATVRGWLRGL